MCPFWMVNTAHIINLNIVENGHFFPSLILFLNSLAKRKLLPVFGEIDKFEYIYYGGSHDHEKPLLKLNVAVRKALGEQALQSSAEKVVCSTV